MQNSNNNKNYYYYNGSNNNTNNNNNNNNQNVVGNNMLQQQQQQQQLQHQQQIRVSNWLQDTNRNQQHYQTIQQQQQQQQQTLQNAQHFQNYITSQQQQHTQTLAGGAISPAATTTTISPLPSMNYYSNQNHQLLQQSQTHASCIQQQQHHTQSRLLLQQQQQQQQQQQNLKHLHQQPLQHPQQVLTPAPSPVTPNGSHLRQQQQQQQQQQQIQQSQPHLTAQQRLHQLQQQQQQAQQLLQQQQQQHASRLVSMECMQTGVPTLTTPTLTPTTLKSIEESFIQLTSEPINAPYQAGFIPPPLGSYISTPTNTTNNNNNSVLTTTTTSVAGISPNAALNNVYVGDTSTGASLPDYGNMNDTDSENSQGSWTANNLNEENSMATTDTSSAATDTISFQNGLNGLGVNTLNNSNSSTNEFTTLALAVATATAAAKITNSGNHNNNTSSSATTTTNATPTRRGGGRRPTTNNNMTPEEEEKRRIRRERNKLAAARCRKRRVDQTNELTDEVQLLEKKREELQKQIESLNGTKQDLEFLLEAHRPTCQRVEAADILSVNTFESLMPNTISTAHDNITGMDTSLATTARSISPLDLKPVLNDQLLAQIKDEPLDSALDSNSSLDQDGPPSPKRLLLSNNNPMIPPPLPNVATLSASLAAASASLNTPIVTAAPISFGSIYSNNPSLSAPLIKSNCKQRPNSLPTIPRNLAQNLGLTVNENKPPTDINGVAIQTPSTGMFNFDSLMDGGTGLTPVSGPLVPNCSSQNKHPLELVTPTSEPSKLVSL